MIASDHLSNFSGHCEVYYKKSLSIRNDHAHTPSYDQDVQACEVILDALEHHLINVHMEFVSRELIDFLLSERVQRYKAELESCGLFIDLVDHEETKTNTDGRILPHQVLLEYTKVRDEKRRSAHEDQMEQRRVMLQELVHGKSLKRLADDTDSDDDSETRIGKYDVTSQAYLHQVRLIFRNFVTKYSSNIGSHSFLAGVNELIEKQLNVNGDDLIGWTFNGSTISEVNINLNSARDKGCYMDDAVELLSAFTIYFFDAKSVEEGEQKEYESLYSFHIHPSISNSFLTSILKEIPTKKLEARPAGRCNKISTRNKAFEKRSNVKGDLDESLFLARWTALQSCDIL